jgi:hypothetical protein
VDVQGVLSIVSVSTVALLHINPASAGTPRERYHSVCITFVWRLLREIFNFSVDDSL